MQEHRYRTTTTCSTTLGVQPHKRHQQRVREDRVAARIEARRDPARPPRVHACYETRPELAIVDSAKGISNLHAPNDLNRRRVDAGDDPASCSTTTALCSSPPFDSMRDIRQTIEGPSPKTGELDNRGSQFYLALYWAEALSRQTDDKALTENEQKIVAELKAAQGHPVDLGGYYLANTERFDQVMRPSPTFNAVLASATRGVNEKQAAMA